MRPFLPVQQTLAESFASWIPEGSSGWFLTCDHASARLPSPWRWPGQDLRFVGTHWSYDLGAQALAFALSQELGAPLVASRFSRLLVDPNRSPEQESFIVSQVEDQSLALNQPLDAAERSSRQALYYDAYHRAIQKALEAQMSAPKPPWLLSIHTFTPLYRGQRRAMQGGVLYDAHEDLAQAFCAGLVKQGWAFEENTPYSGYDGLIEGVSRHGKAHGCPYLELEVRQDLACHPTIRHQLVMAIAQVCRELR